MNKEQAMEILRQFQNWNIGQKSIDSSFSGKRTAEDDIYDLRRELIREAYRALLDSPNQTDNGEKK